MANHLKMAKAHSSLFRILTNEETPIEPAWLSRSYSGAGGLGCQRRQNTME